MSTRVQPASWVPDPSWWVILACVLAVGLLGNWFLAGGVLVVLIIYVLRPFDFVTAYLLVTGGSVFVNYQGEVGGLTKQLGFLSIVVVFALFCYALSARGRLLSLPRTDLTIPLLVYLGWSMVNFVRGVMSAYPPKFLLLEFYPVLAIGTSFLVANVFQARRDLRLVFFSLLVIAYGSAAFGFWAFAKVQTHMAGVYFGPVPGMVALILINMALRSGQTTTRLGWLALAIPLVVHQFLSFGRGLWLGMMVGVISSVLIYSIGRGRQGWARSGNVLGTLLAAGIFGAVALTVVYGRTDILTEAGTRFLSIGDTKYKKETLANMARFVEYAAVIRDIQKAPWIGYGLGYTFFMTSVLITARPAPQYWVHQNYLLVWLKQGVLGLLMFIWMLGSAFRMGARHARRREDGWESAWLAGTAAATALISVYSLTDFPFDSVQPVFFLALVWGASMAISRDGTLRFRWSSPDPVVSQTELPALRETRS